MNLLLPLLLLVAQGRQFAVANQHGLPLSGLVPCALPFGPGELPAGGSVRVGRHLCPFKPIEWWADGSPRRVIADVPVTVPAGEERRYQFEPSKAPAGGGFLSALGAVKVEVLLKSPGQAEATIVPFVSPWTTLFVSPSRWEGVCRKEVGTSSSGLRLSLFATLLTGQPWARLTLVVGNDWLTRPNASPYPLDALDVRFSGGYGAPSFAWAHGVMTIEPFRRYRLLWGATLGDAQRWGTEFVVATPRRGTEGADLAGAEQAWSAPPLGLALPDVENHTRGYAFFGRLRGEVWPARIADAPHPQRSREFWEKEGRDWLAGAPNAPLGTPGSNGGLWPYDTSGSGAQFGWGPAPCSAQDKALSPAGARKWKAVAFLALRYPDHYADAQGRPLTRATFPGLTSFLDSGLPSSPVRLLSARAEHFTGNYGWKGRDALHTEVEVIHRALHVWGDAWLAEELASRAGMAGFELNPYKVGPDGRMAFLEGRGTGRLLKQLLVGWLTAREANLRVELGEHLLALSSRLVSDWSPLPGYAPPSLFSMSSYWSPGYLDRSRAQVEGCGLPWPPSPPVGVVYPFTGAFHGGIFWRAWELTGFEGFKVAAERAGDEVARLVQGATIADLYLPPGSPCAPRAAAAALWSYPTVDLLRHRAPAIASFADAVRGAYAAPPGLYNVAALNWLFGDSLP